MGRPAHRRLGDAPRTLLGAIGALALGGALLAVRGRPCPSTIARDVGPNGALAGDASPVEDGGGCVTFVGDVMLSRGVAQETRVRGVSPWRAMAQPARGMFVGNLEGAVDDGPCLAPKGAPCLSIRQEDLSWLKTAPFVALSLANNHSHDHGDGGYSGTARGLSRLGIHPLTEEDAPTLLPIGGRTWAFVAIDLAGRASAEWPDVVLRARMQIGLARAHTPWVAVLPHWGREYDPHPLPEQERLAALFHEWGALLVVGAHAHVPQDTRCTEQTADYFGLGNHLFDQGDPKTWRGLEVRCCPQGPADALTCTTSVTERTRESTFPSEAADPPQTCALAPPPVSTSWLHHPAHDSFAYVQPFASLGPDTFLALHRAYASFDHEEALRPYVFRMSPPRAGDDGAAWRFRELWRGTALSRPLLAARLFRHDAHEYLCAILRDDSFLHLDPTTRGRVHQVYEWTGFGFHGVDDEDALERCERM